MRLFEEIGCADCHIPEIRTQKRRLALAFPEVHVDPDRNVYVEVHLEKKPASFPRDSGGGLRVSAFSDLKRHDMGPGLAESAGMRLDDVFITARLWGVADTAPYLHDGRATTLSEAILLHGGEALGARDAFESLRDEDRINMLEFLRSLRTPREMAQ